MTKASEQHEVVTKSKPKVATPKKYKVILLNDDYTTMEFVVEVLQTVFHKSSQEASALMLAIHTYGKGVAGVYSFEIAEMKCALVTEIARRNEHPLRCLVEEE